LSGNNEIPYTLKAYPNYTSTKKGEWWVGAVEMTDVITLPDGYELVDSVKTTIHIKEKAVANKTTGTN
jgi:hypothetical protein